MHTQCPYCETATDCRFVCHSRDFRYNPDERFTVVQCIDCDLVFTLPQLNWDALEAYYPGEYYESRGCSGLNPTDGDGLQRWLEPDSLIADINPGSMLEIGCGTGDVLAYWRSKGWEVFGIEPSDSACRIAREDYGLDVLQTTLEDAEIDSNQFDLILFDNVFEHLQRPFNALSTCRDLLAPGGHVVIESPNIESLSFALFRSYWSDLDVPRHQFHFSPDVLERAARNEGFRLDRVTFSGYPITMRYSLNRYLDDQFGFTLGRWITALLLPISLSARMFNRGDRFRLRLKKPVKV